jgi:omega-6 fatty acid desaturase (delta-12 desaturase)
MAVPLAARFALLQDEMDVCATGAKPTESELRGILRAMRSKSKGKAWLIFLADVALYALSTWGALTSHSGLIACLCGAFAGMAIAMLFVVGHDACHRSFTSSRALNGVIGRVAFLPSLTPFGAWEQEHNRAHHVYTNLKGRDPIWAPFSKAEFDALPGWRRALERCYRTPLGVGPYYAIEIWARLLILPRGHAPRLTDYAICYLYGSALLAVGWAFGWQALAAGVVWPFLCWNWLMGWAIFDHHTHPDVPWFDNEREWRAAQAQSRCTVHLVLPRVLDALLHHIMQHTAHHLDVTIPLYNLRDAQRALEAAGPALVVYRWTPLTFIRHLRICKLYHFENHQWIGFDGKPRE